MFFYISWVVFHTGLCGAECGGFYTARAFSRKCSDERYRGTGSTNFGRTVAAFK